MRKDRGADIAGLAVVLAAPRLSPIDEAVHAVDDTAADLPPAPLLN